MIFFFLCNSVIDSFRSLAADIDEPGSSRNLNTKDRIAQIEIDQLQGAVFNQLGPTKHAQDNVRINHRT